MKSQDPREQALNDAARDIMVRLNYNPHFGAIEERVKMETLLWLARFDALVQLGGTDEMYRVFATTALLATPTTERQVGKHPALGAPYDLSEKPIPMILFCPRCRLQHIDRAEPHKPDCRQSGERILHAPAPCTCGVWRNPIHKSHLCAGCGHVWRPTDVPTTGVAEITTHGEKDDTPIRGLAGFRP